MKHENEPFEGRCVHCNVEFRNGQPFYPENSSPNDMNTEWAEELTAWIITEYSEHYSFPPQGESHMRDCIIDGLAKLESKPPAPRSTRATNEHPEGDEPRSAPCAETRGANAEESGRAHSPAAPQRDVVSVPREPTVYTVHAYRWGEPDNHSYIVGVYPKKHAALKAADTEEEYRGGNKYACEVLEWALGAGIEGDANPPAKVIKPLPERSLLSGLTRAEAMIRHQPAPSRAERKA